MVTSSWIGHSMELFSGELQQRGWRKQLLNATLAHVHHFLQWVDKPLHSITEQDARIFALELAETKNASDVREVRASLDVFYRYFLHQRTTIAG